MCSKTKCRVLYSFFSCYVVYINVQIRVKELITQIMSDDANYL